MISEMDYTDYIVSCKGHIATRPRIVNRRSRSNSTKIHTVFDLRLNEGVMYKDNLEKTLFRLAEERVRSIFEADEAVYTDTNGVIRSFIPPKATWWIEIESISWKKHVKVLPPDATLTPNNPVILDAKTGEVEPA